MVAIQHCWHVLTVWLYLVACAYVQDAWVLLQPSPAAAALLQMDECDEAKGVGYSSGTGKRGRAGGPVGTIGRGRGRAVLGR
jgi:hypothetical protein